MNPSVVGVSKAAKLPDSSLPRSPRCLGLLLLASFDPLGVSTLSTPFLEALSTLSDRQLRRTLGARAFLRGLDYARKGAVSDTVLNDVDARGLVKGSDPEPYSVTLGIGEMGLLSGCSCAAFAKNQGHCKHIAAVLIALRDQHRPRPVALPQPSPSDSLLPASPSSPSLPAPGGPRTVSSEGAPSPPGMGRRAKRRAARENRGGGGSAAQGRQQGTYQSSGQSGGQGSGVGSGHSQPVQNTTGVYAWMPEGTPRMPDNLEYRLVQRPGSFQLTVLDGVLREPLSPAALFAIAEEAPGPEREVFRRLARVESNTGRRTYLEVRGEEAGEVLAALRGRKVILEPQMMELRFGDEPLRPRFDLDLSHDAARVYVRVYFQRAGDARKFHLGQGTWLEGYPSWHIDATDGVARPLDTRVSPASMRRLMRSPTIWEPADRLGALLSQGLPHVALTLGAELPELSQVADVVDHTPTFVMRASGSLADVKVVLRALYDEVQVDVRADGMSPPIMLMPPQPNQRRALCLRCDIAAQQEAASRLIALGLSPDEKGEAFSANGPAAIKFWTEGVGQLPEAWDLFVPDDLVDVQIRSKKLSASARVGSGVDWLSLQLSFESEGVSVTQEELARCLHEGRAYVRLTDGSYAKMDEAQVREVLARQAEMLVGGAQPGHLPLSQAGRLQDLLAHIGSAATVSAGAKELFSKLASVDELKEVKKPKGLKADMRPYQLQGLQWLSFLHEIGSGGVLADDMGLGKTLQTIALMLAVKAVDDKVKGGPKFCALIVAPTSVVTNWQRELARFAPTLKVVLWHGGDRKARKEDLEQADVVLTSYALLRRDEELFAEMTLRYAILDEAQHIKNPHSATAKAAKRLRASRRLALSGTPIENRLSEIWSIFDFVSPGLLGPLDKFEERYARPIDAGDDTAAARLRTTIHPFILRRTKGEVAKDLPEKIETDHICDLPTEQGSLYAAVLKEVRAQVLKEVEIQGLAKSQLQILAGLTRLRQAACDPRLLKLPKEFTDEDSGKLQALRELIQTSVAGGHRVLVFSQFVSMLTLIRAALTKDGVGYEYLDGSTKDRMACVENFQRDDGPPVFLISLKAGGSGLNLTAADTVIHFDPWWNPAVEDQATDRAHRIGQTKVVTTYRLIAKGTIEEKILELSAKKRELVGAVLSEDAGGAKKLTKTDVESLFAD